MKKVIVIAIIAAVIGAGLWLFIPRRSRMENTIKCYDLYGVDFSLSDDTRLEEIADYRVVECNFDINHSLVFGTRIYGTVKINGTEYIADSANFTVTGLSWIGASLTNVNADNSAPLPVYLYLSSDRKHVMLYDGREEGKVYWVGAEGNMKMLKIACEAFGLDFFNTD